MKKLVLIIIVLSFIFTSCRLLKICDNSVPRKVIFAYVNANYEFIEKFPYDKIEEFDKLHAIDSYQLRYDNEKKVIEEYFGDTKIVKSVYAYNENILQFYCGGKGMLDSSTYVGFYYSKDDKPYAFEFCGEELVEIEPDVYEWEDRQHKICTEKIRDNWYYYIMEWR